MMKLPEEARIAELGSSKSYTKMQDGNTVKISAILNKTNFYIYPITKLPKDCEDQGFTINRQGGCQVSWAGEKEEWAWALAKKMAGWQ